MKETEDSIVSSIPDLEADVQALREQLRVAEDLLRTAREDAADFQVGDLVKARRTGSDWAEAIVREVNAHGWTTWYRVSFRKKDGEFSNQRRRVFGDVRAL